MLWLSIWYFGRLDTVSKVLLIVQRFYETNQDVTPENLIHQLFADYS